jgi:two-component system sensor histidine kinase GlrK
MKVSSKIIVGFLFLMLLAVVFMANELNAIHQMQAVNRELSQTNLRSAKLVLEIQKLADLFNEDAQKYFSSLDAIYDDQIGDVHKDFQDHLGYLRETINSDRERTELEKLSMALDGCWEAYNALKKQNKLWGPDELPPDLTLAVNHLEAQSENMLGSVQLVIKERVAAAGEVGDKAERVFWIAGGFSLFLGVVVSALFVRSINDPLRRLIQGTGAIAKGQFWHRLPARGNDEFAELARHFNSMTERLGELDKMKKDFVSHVSHDLKAPLASIRQIMHLLLQEIPGPLSEQQKSLIQLSYGSAERLASMVGNLLDVSRMEAGSMEYQMATHDIVALVKGVMIEFDVQAQQKLIHFRLECEQPAVNAECDRERIVQVVGNLFENALKFSPNDSEIVTRVGHGKGSEILISVSDSGPGVPDGHKDKIFQKFHQVKHGKKLTGQGVGLGLAICKTIIEAHRGQIWVEDNPNGGSIFSFVLQPGAREEVLTCGQTA